MTENLIHDNKENQPILHLVLQLEEARLGDHDRLESIKRTLSSGQELPQVDRQYLGEQVSQLHETFGPILMAEWERDFAQKIHEKKKNMYKIDKKSLKHTSTQLKQAIENEKEIKWTLDLISQLKEIKLGSTEKLNYISRLLKSGENIGESDKQYLKEKSRYLRRVVDCKTKVTQTQNAIRKLQENEIKHSKKLEEIRQSVENGELVSEREQNYLSARYEKLQSALDQQNRVEWTIQTIQQLKELGVGDSKKLDKIKELLEDDIPVPENDTKYLREESKLLMQTLKHKRKIDWIVGLITELQEMEIGNPERLAVIKKALEERKPVPENEINYLTQKCRLLMMAKESEKEYETTNGNQAEESNYNSILSELNTTIKELEKLESKFQVA